MWWIIGGFAFLLIVLVLNMLLGGWGSLAVAGATLFLCFKFFPDSLWAMALTIPAVLLGCFGLFDVFEKR